MEFKRTENNVKEDVLVSYNFTSYEVECENCNITFQKVEHLAVSFYTSVKTTFLFRSHISVTNIIVFLLRKFISFIMKHV